MHDVAGRLRGDNLVVAEHGLEARWPLPSHFEERNQETS